ncbi:hypothetical protein L7F22_011410 [Adiantum nelumboides]|nr:hypothetical protein [Adiantum nelumboides]
MLRMFRLTSEAKLWWKQYYCDKGVAQESQSRDDIKQAVRERYLSPAHQSLKMNKFFTLKQNEFTLEEYFSKFVTLRRYGSILTTEQQVVRFCQGLNAPLDAQLEAMQPTSLQDALLSAKPLSKKRIFQSMNFGESQRRVNPRFQEERPQGYALLAITQGQRETRCFECNKPRHYRRQCPRLAFNAATEARLGGNHQEGRNGGRGRDRGRVARVFEGDQGRNTHAQVVSNELTLGEGLGTDI